MTLGWRCGLRWNASQKNAARSATSSARFHAGEWGSDVLVPFDLDMVVVV